MYGTLVDPVGIRTQLQRYLSDEALNVAKVWRRKQLEYTFLLTMMEQYEDFEQVSRKALDYALATGDQQLNQDQKDTLIAQYNDLERFDDVQPGLQRLKKAG